MNKISVIVPVWNAESFLRTTLDSVAAATEHLTGGIECICVDDGSTDSSGKILDEYAARSYGKLQMKVIHKGNGGEGSARNAALEIATGIWLTCLDADDVYAPDAFLRAEEAIERNPAADIISFRMRRFRDNESPTFGNGNPNSRMRVYDTTQNLEYGVFGGVGVCATLFRRKTFSRVAFCSLPLGADRVYVAQCLVLANQVVLSDTVIYANRRRPDSMSGRNWNIRKNNSMIDRCCRTIDILQGSGKRIDSRDVADAAWLWLADAPKSIGQIAKADRKAAWEHWITSLRTWDSQVLPKRFKAARWLILRVSWSCRLSRLVAGLCHFVGLTRG